MFWISYSFLLKLFITKIRDTSLLAGAFWDNTSFVYLFGNNNATRIRPFSATQNLMSWYEILNTHNDILFHFIIWFFLFLLILFINIGSIMIENTYFIHNKSWNYKNVSIYLLFLVKECLRYVGISFMLSHFLIEVFCSCQMRINSLSFTLFHKNRHLLFPNWKLRFIIISVIHKNLGDIKWPIPEWENIQCIEILYPRMDFYDMLMYLCVCVIQ